MICSQQYTSQNEKQQNFKVITCRKSLLKIVSTPFLCKTTLTIIISHQSMSYKNITTVTDRLVKGGFGVWAAIAINQPLRKDNLQNTRENVIIKLI
jgi:hypothetical protein